ncbi:MAG: SixA phosphatase family protein [Bacteroidota bacterium]
MSIKKKKYLYLLRHAKAEKGWANLDDMDRPLHPIGVEEARRIATMFCAVTPMPDMVLASPSVRTYSTALVFSKIMGFGNDKITLDQRIYEADLKTLMRVVSDIPNNVDSVLMVGHNPSMTQLADYFHGNIAHMSTSSLVGFSLQVEEWMHFDIAKVETLCQFAP